MTKGRDLYERYRRVEPTAENWVFLPYDEKMFWEKLARVVG